MSADEFILIRKDLGISQSALARALGQSYATVSRWERGERDIPLEIARQMECIYELLERANRGAEPTYEEIREAVLTTGITGVVAGAALNNLVSKRMLLALSAISGFAWVGVIIGAGISSALPFFNAPIEPNSTITEGGNKKQPE